MHKAQLIIKAIAFSIILWAPITISYFGNTDYAVETNTHSATSLQINENTKNGPIKGENILKSSSSYKSGPSDRLKPAQSNTETAKPSSVSTREQYDYSKSAEEKMSNK